MHILLNTIMLYFGQIEVTKTFYMSLNLFFMYMAIQNQFFLSLFRCFRPCLMFITISITDNIDKTKTATKIDEAYLILEEGSSIEAKDNSNC